MTRDVVRYRGVDVPLFGKIDLHKLNAAMTAKGLSISERMRIKGELKLAGLLD